MSDLAERKRLHSGAYIEKYERTPVARLERLVPLLKLRGGEVLADFGCGSAMLLPLIHDQVAEYHGVDFSSDFIEAAHRRAAAGSFTRCRFYCEDIVEFCSRHQQRFDVAVAFDFSEHIDDDDFLRIFTAIRGSLRPGGRLLLHTPNLDFLIERLKDWGVLKQFPEHIAVRNARAYRRLLVQCGFAEDGIRVLGLPHYNVLRLVHPLHHLPLIGRWFLARLVIECVG